MKFPRPLVLVSCLAVLLGSGCRKFHAPPPAKASPSSVSNPSEQGWIIGTIINEMTRMAAFAADPKHLPPPGQVNLGVGTKSEWPIYAISIRYPEATTAFLLPVTGNPWDPAIYARVAKELVDHYHLTAAGNYQDDALRSLTAFSVTALQQENKSLSSYLTAHPTDPAAHQSAAVLLGTLAMWENSGWLWDPKEACARSTAHLALAAALQPTVANSDESALAQLLIGLIIDTKTECTGRIADLMNRAQARPDLFPWARAAALRNTRDWRLPPNGSDGTQFEKIEKFRTYADGATTELGAAYLDAAHPTDDVEISRIAFSTGFGVELGHYYTRDAVRDELKEIQLLLDSPLPKNQADWEALTAWLNQVPATSVTLDDAGNPTIQVIDRGLWCVTLQRHLLLAAYETWDFMQDQWGVPDEAAAFWTKMEKYFSGLRLFPLIAFSRAYAMEAPFYSVTQLQELFEESPQDVPDFTWRKACSTATPRSSPASVTANSPGSRPPSPPAPPTAPAPG